MSPFKAITDAAREKISQFLSRSEGKRQDRSEFNVGSPGTAGEPSRQFRDNAPPISKEQMHTQPLKPFKVKRFTEKQFKP